MKSQVRGSMHWFPRPSDWLVLLLSLKVFQRYRSSSVMSVGQPQVKKPFLCPRSLLHLLVVSFLSILLESLVKGAGGMHWSSWWNEASRAVLGKWLCRRNKLLPQLLQEPVKYNEIPQILLHIVWYTTVIKYTVLSLLICSFFDYDYQNELLKLCQIFSLSAPIQPHHYQKFFWPPVNCVMF